MSYARFSRDSAVYVFAHVGGYLECCGCSLGDKWDFHSTAEMLAHLEAHKAAGHEVPEYCIEGLKVDAEENDEWIRTGKWSEK